MKVNLNLLPVVVALVEEGTVSAAAHKLRMTQPAVSRALAQLREAFADPLFVRTARGMSPTPRTVKLLGPVREMLGILANGVFQVTAFDPRKLDGVVTISLSDVGEMATLPGVLSRLDREAPNVNVRSVSVPPVQLQHALETGEVDLALGYFPDLRGNNFFQQRLFVHGFVCIVRSDHPITAERLTLKQFTRLGHAVVRAEGRSQEVLERFLLKRGIRRREVLQTPHFMSIPHIIARTDLVATVPVTVGRSFARFKAVRVVQPPFELPTVELKQHWHRKFHQDPRNRWLRGLVHSLADEWLAELQGAASVVARRDLPAQRRVGARITVD